MENKLSETHWICKHNALNEVKNCKMTYPQLQLLSLYLSKLNPLDITSRAVTFTLSEYAQIMGMQRFNITQLKKTAAECTQLVVTFCKESEKEEFTKKYGYLREFEVTAALLFRKFAVHKNNDNEWCITMECHNDVVPLMFNLQKHYFKYELWNALQLSSKNQQRMYEILKQYEKAKVRQISVTDLREFLGISENEHAKWADFRRDVLEPCQNAMKNNTDIQFTWEEVRKGRGGKIVALKFNIEKNKKYKLSFFDKLKVQSPALIEGDVQGFEEVNDKPTADKFTEKLLFLCEACNNEFNKEEIKVLFNYIKDIIPPEYGGVAERDIKMFEYLKDEYDYLNMQATKKNIPSRFGYLKAVIQAKSNYMAIRG